MVCFVCRSFYAFHIAGSEHVRCVTESPMRKTNEERFWAMVNKNGPLPKNRPDLGQCWLWTGCVGKPSKGGKNGYGHFFLATPTGHYRQISAARYAYELCHGPITHGLEPDHLCRVRRCVNPCHLEPVTRRENVRRGNNPQGINSRKTHCNNGHPLSGENLRIERTGSRRCRTCARIARQKWEERNAS